MRPLFFPVFVLALLGLALPSGAQECDTLVRVNNCFDVEFMGVDFDGFQSELTYCVTGVDVPGFGPLRTLMVEADPACISEDNLADCDPEECFLSPLDPLFEGMTGVKWVDLDLGIDETECFSFLLDGDWTGSIGSVGLAVEATVGLGFGEICGPICELCEAALQVRPGGPGEPVHFRTALRHNLPTPVETPLYFKLVDADGHRIHSWTAGPFLFELGTTLTHEGPIPDQPELAPGDYELLIAIEGMSGLRKGSAKFTIADE